MPAEARRLAYSVTVVGGRRVEVDRRAAAPDWYYVRVRPMAEGPEWRSPESLEDHFRRHGAEVGARDEAERALRADLAGLDLPQVRRSASW